jgi:hypothetical protein
MSTPTPRTDAAYAKWQEGWDRTPFGPDLARKLERELATERARLDWVFRNCKVFAADYTIHDREDLGAAMKEGAK